MADPAKNGVALKAFCGLAATLIAALTIATVTALGTTRVHTSRLDTNARDIVRVETVADENAKHVSDVRADIKEIRAILERIEESAVVAHADRGM